MYRFIKTPPLLFHAQRFYHISDHLVTVKAILFRKSPQGVFTQVRRETGKE
jgi:hypothetical protein